jgi:hypothetical protein
MRVLLVFVFNFATVGAFLPGLHGRHLCSQYQAMSSPASEMPVPSREANLVFSLVEYLKHDDSAPRLVLASQSPRRREIFDLMGLNGLYSVEPSPLDESKLQEQLQEQLKTQTLSPKQYTSRLAEAKAEALAETYASSDRTSSSSSNVVFLGSDTIVVSRASRHELGRSF